MERWNNGWNCDNGNRGGICGEITSEVVKKEGVMVLIEKKVRSWFQLLEPPDLFTLSSKKVCFSE